MIESYINAISFYLPESVLDNKKISEEHPEWSIDKIAEKTGINSRHFTAKDEFASDLAIGAVESLLFDYEIDKADIDFVLYCTQSPDYFLPTTACVLQNKLGLRKDIGALDYNLGCSGYVYGLSLAKGLVSTGQAKNVLLITAETYTKYINPLDKSNKTLFGDAASASLISTKPAGYRIGEFSFGTDGGGAGNLIVRNGGIRFRTDVGHDEFSEGNFVRNNSNLYMNGSEIFSFTSKSVPVLVNNVLEKNQISFDQIDFFVFHQANKYMLDFIRKKIGIPQEKFTYCVEKYGNTVSSTIPIALKDCFFSSNVMSNNILLAGFGVGYSWAGCVIHSC